MQELGDRIYSDEMLRKELCYMCLTHRPLRLVYHISPNRKKNYGVFEMYKDEWSRSR